MKIVIEYKQMDNLQIEDVAINKVLSTIREYYDSTKFAWENLKITYDGDATYFRRIYFTAKDGVEQDVEFNESVKDFGTGIINIILEREPSLMNKKIFVSIVKK